MRGASFNISNHTDELSSLQEFTILKRFTVDKSTTVFKHPICFVLKNDSSEDPNRYVSVIEVTGEK